MEKLHRFEDDWTAISEHFRLMFNGIGHLSITEDLLTFRSLPPSVATGISITRSGELVANMPLHAIESVFDTVAFSSDLTSLTLAGGGSSYTYNVPPALLALRSI
ncbi:MAG: hypothetical protein VXY14_06870 [Candidatus Thermoplasmatota archaeon]|nr:hypothetical protein [Candidatus Thermoplasmatota archaeon]